MKTIYPQLAKTLKVKKTALHAMLPAKKNFCAVLFVTVLTAATAPFKLLAQVPIISYTSPQTYILNTAITTLTPSGSGVAAQAYSAIPLTLGYGFSLPTGVAIDASGNVYVADNANGEVKKIPYSAGKYGAPVILASGITQPTGVAVDESGNIYVAAYGNNAVYKISYSNGSYGTTVQLGSGFSNPYGVSVDMSGNVYVADNGNNAVKEIPYSIGTYGTPVAIGSGFAGPHRVVPDAFGNLYVADSGNGAIKKIPYSGGAYGSPLTIASGFSALQGVAVDACGNVYVADTFNSAVKEIPYNNGTYGAPVILGSGFVSPTDVATDGVGSVYAANQGVNAVQKVQPVGGYYIGAALPAGLSFSNATGAITGTPTATSPAANYTITAWNTMGSGTAAVNISVKLAQTITFNSLAAVNYGKADFAPGATSTNNTIPITYGSSNMAVATISAAGNIHIVGAGATTITASQAASATYAAATPVNQTLTVGKAALTITANNQKKTYGAAVPTLTVNYSGFVNGDTKTSLTTQPTVSTIATASSPVNTYPIKVSGAVDPNYSITYTAGVLTVGQAALTITANNQTKNYGAANPTLTVAYTGFVNGDTKSSLTTQPTVGTTATTSSPVGTYPIAASGAADPNYTITYKAGTLTVNKAALNITANNHSKNYGSANPTLTVSYNGFVNGDTYSSLTTQPTISTPATTSSPAGTYPITASGAADPNYIISYTAGTLTVGKAALNITANNQYKTYGSANPTLTVSYTGFVNGDTKSSLTTQPTVTTTATTSSPAGAYPITASGAADPNYTITYTAGTLTVNKAALNITANNQSKTYGSANPTLTVSYNGFVNGDTKASLTTQPTVSTTATTSSPAGTYPITASGAVDPNYTITYTAGTLTVGKAALNITANNQSKIYGSVNPTLTVSYTGFVNGDTKSSLTTQPTVTTAATTSSPAGTYPITASGAADPNYTITYTAGTLTVGKAALNITANNQSKIYGSVNPTLTVAYTGFVNGDTKSSLTTQPTVSTTATTSSPAGTYPITASGAADPNYTITYTAGTLTVNKAALNITANNQSKTYGSANPTLTVSYNGFVNGDTKASLTTQPTVSTTATTSSPAGAYPITASGAVDPNYTITYTAGTLTVNKAALNITANNQSKIYGSANPALTVSYTGFVNGDTKSSLTTQPTVTTAATTSSPAGTYPITASGAADPNYTITYTAGTLTVGKAALNITANNQSKIYGSVNPTLTVACTGFVNGDTYSSLTTQPTVSTTATTSSPAGAYPITASGAADPNYTITYTAGTLTVNKAALNITANNQSKIYGSANPTLTVSYTGFVNGDTKASLTTQPTVSTTATSSSPANTYPITAAGAVDPNYAITYTSGTLTVGKATLSITANNQTKTYGAANPELTLSYSGFVNGDTYSSLTTQPTVSTTAITTSPVGTYPITVTGAVDPNYTISYTEGMLTVVPATKALAEASQELSLFSDSLNKPIANNILTPNGDGVNDTWLIKNIEYYPNNSVTVYDRLGHIVFAKKGYANDWAGTYGGSILNQGTYYYLVDLGNGTFLKGFITVVRDR